MKSREQLRLQQTQKAKIEERLKDAGFKVSGNKSHIWFYKGKRYIGGFDWVTNQGWRLLLVQPTLFAVADLDIAVEEIKATIEGIIDVEKKWGDYRKSPSTKSWVAYQGAQVTHHMRLHSTEAKKP